MDQKKAIMALLAEILSIMNGEPGPSKPSYPPKRGAPRNGSALVILSLILGILLGVLVAMVLKGCSMQNACIIRSEPNDPMGLLDALGDIEIDTDSETFLDGSVF